MPSRTHPAPRIRARSIAALFGVLATLVAAAGLAVAGPATAAAPHLAATQVTTTGTLTLTNPDPAPGDDLVFQYTTDQPAAKNWVGVYNSPADGPTDQTYHAASTAYTYTGAQTSGTVTVSGAKLTPGHDITAYFLANDGYTWLAQPITFHVGYPTTGSITLENTAPKVGDTLVFDVNTGTKDNDLANDWVGIYNDPTKAPIHQAYPGNGSTVWSAFSGTTAKVSIASSALTAGHDVVAYLMYHDQYQWLAQPITFRLAAAATTAPPTATGTLALTTANPVVGQPLTFTYSTATPNATNWIGLYDNPSGGPTDQKSHGASTVWTYVQGTSGTATIPSDALTSGHSVSAYLLYNDGYTWLAKPISFTLSDPAPYTPTPTTSHFVTNDVTEGSTPPATKVTVPVAGLWFGPNGAAPSAPVTFAKTGGADWLSVSPTGVISGTSPSAPTAPGRTPLVTITAKDPAGVTDQITVEFPLSAPGTAPTLKAATLSMWDAGSHVTAPQEKLVSTILLNGLDVVGLHDTAGTQATAIAKLLGWNVVETAAGQGLISRYPLGTSSLSAPAGLPAVAANASIFGHPVQLWSAGLDGADFGPTLACSASPGDVVAHEKTTVRYQQATALASAVKASRTKSAPVVVLADLESPAAADWTSATSKQHCGVGPLAWPVPAALASAGLTDTYRAAHPDPVASSGQTTSVFPTTTAAVSTDSPERIDYVEAAGTLSTTESHTLVDGFPQGPSNSQGNSWISNRAAVVTSFVVDPPAAPGHGSGGSGSGGSGGGGSAAGPGHGSGSGGSTGTTLPAALAWTGSPAVAGIVLAAFAALLAGAALLVIRRRRMSALASTQIPLTENHTNQDQETTL